MTVTTTKPQRLNALLDELLSCHAVFARAATAYCLRSNRRAPDKQKELKLQVDRTLKSLIAVFAKCDKLIEQIAVVAGAQPDYELNLYRKIFTILEHVGPQHVEAIEKITAQSRWDEARFRGWW
jgi:hypothetical protein